MERLESLTTTLQNITLYDIKSMYNQVQFSSILTNVVLTNVGQERRPQRERDGGQGQGGYQR